MKIPATPPTTIAPISFAISHAETNPSLRFSSFSTTTNEYEVVVLVDDVVATGVGDIRCSCVASDVVAVIVVDVVDIFDVVDGTDGVSFVTADDVPLVVKFFLVI